MLTLDDKYCERESSEGGRYDVLTKYNVPLFRILPLLNAL